LIELLVVIAIIAILAAILFPVFARAREKARQTSCLSNVKQLALGFIMYSSDSDERFPYWNWGNRKCGGAGHPTYLWYMTIYPYVKNAQLYACPSTSGNNKCANNATEYPGIGIIPVVNYALNEPISAGCCGRNYKDMQFPAETLLIGDARSSLGGWHPPDPPSILWRYATTEGGTCACGSGNSAPDDSQARHNAGSNIGFCDGHAKWMKWNNITNPRVRYRANLWR
jgi:prepilin-type processing-associated H-X9-DG protein